VEESAELHIIHAWYLYGEHYISQIGMNKKQVQEAKIHEKEHHKQGFDALLERSILAI